MKTPEIYLPVEKLRKAASATEKFYLKKGYFVQHLPMESLPPLQDSVLECGDGRYGCMADRKINPALFGGLWGVVALHPAFRQKGITEDAIKTSIDMLIQRKMLPGIHGDNHDENLGCGFLGLLMQNKLPEVNRLIINPEQLKSLAKEFHVHHTILPGEHQEQVLRISFVPGYAPELDPAAFRLTGDIALTLGIPLDIFNLISEQTIRLLTQDNVKQVQIAAPF